MKDKLAHEIPLPEDSKKRPRPRPRARPRITAGNGDENSPFEVPSSDPLPSSDSDPGFKGFQTKRPALEDAAQPKSSSSIMDIVLSSPLPKETSPRPKSPQLTKIIVDLVVQQFPPLKTFTSIKHIPLLLHPQEDDCLFWAYANSTHFNVYDRPSTAARNLDVLLINRELAQHSPFLCTREGHRQILAQGTRLLPQPRQGAAMIRRTVCRLMFQGLRGSVLDRVAQAIQERLGPPDRQDSSSAHSAARLTSSPPPRRPRHRVDHPRLPLPTPSPSPPLRRHHHLATQAALGNASQPKSSNDDDPLHIIFTTSTVAELSSSSSKSTKPPTVTIDVDGVLRPEPRLKSLITLKDIPLLLYPGHDDLLFWLCPSSSAVITMWADDAARRQYSQVATLLQLVAIAMSSLPTDVWLDCLTPYAERREPGRHIIDAFDHCWTKQGRETQDDREHTFRTCLPKHNAALRLDDFTKRYKMEDVHPSVRRLVELAEQGERDILSTPTPASTSRSPSLPPSTPPPSGTVAQAISLPSSPPPSGTVARATLATLSSLTSIGQENRPERNSVLRLNTGFLEAIKQQVPVLQKLARLREIPLIHHPREEGCLLWTRTKSTSFTDLWAPGMQATYQSLAALMQLPVIATSTVPVDDWIRQLEEYLIASDIGKYLWWALDALFGFHTALHHTGRTDRLKRYQRYLPRLRNNRGLVLDEITSKYAQDDMHPSLWALVAAAQAGEPDILPAAGDLARVPPLL